MLLEISSYIALAAVLFVLKELVITALRNHSAHQIFKKRSPNLPVVPNAGIFSGHLHQVIWARQSWKIYESLHKQYGATFGMFHCDKPFVSTTDLDLIKSMVLDNPNDHVERMRINSPIAELENDSIFTSDASQWRKIRGFIAPAFTKTKVMMPSVQSDMATLSDKLVKSFENRLDKAELCTSEKFITLDFDEISLRYANALVFKCFYKQDKVIDFESETDRLTKVVDNFFKYGINSVFKFCMVFPALSPIVNWLLHFHPLGEMRIQVMAYIKQQTLINLSARQQVKEAEQKFNTTCRDDEKTFNPDDFLLKDGSRFERNMLDFVIDQFHAGKSNFRKSEYFNSTLFLFLAASKTSADAISKLVYNLAAHQDVQEKLRASVEAEGIDSEYLHWCIYESLRLFPPGPIGCSRVISGDLVTKNGIVIPAGSFVYTCPYLIHRLKEYWGDDADEYKPERWRNSAQFHPVQFLAFGAGKRNCFGGQFAVSELKMLFSKLLTRYRFKLAPDTNADTVMKFDFYLLFFLAELPTNIKISRL